VGLFAGNCPQHCKQVLPKKVGVAAHAVIQRKPSYLTWVIYGNRFFAQQQRDVTTVAVELLYGKNSPL
jgi:hypothetical protein